MAAGPAQCSPIQLTPVALGQQAKALLCRCDRKTYQAQQMTELTAIGLGVEVNGRPTGQMGRWLCKHGVLGIGSEVGALASTV